MSEEELKLKPDANISGGKVTWVGDFTLNYIYSDY